MRGIVEGFHGEPWSRQVRLQVLEFAGRHGFDTYVYAPQDEPKRGQRWREPYDADEAASFAELAAAATAAGIQLIYSISPGVDMRFSDSDDFHALSAKVEQMRRLGFAGAMLALDDVEAALAGADASRFGGHPGAAHAYLANWLYREQRTLKEPFRLMLVPAEHHATASSPYLAALADLLNREIDVVWTGPAVLCERITAAQARSFGQWVGRSPVLWDNYPVNDRSPRKLFLGPVTGRGWELPRSVRGVLVNPMRQGLASLVPLLTYAEYLRAPGTYRPETALRAAVAEVGGAAAGALARLVEFQRGSHLVPRRPPTPRLVSWLQAPAAAGAGEPASEVPEWVAADLRTLESVPAALEGCPVAGLGAEVAPWAGKLARSAAVLRGALTGGERAALVAELATLRAEEAEIGEPLLAAADELLRAEPARVGRA